MFAALKLELGDMPYYFPIFAALLLLVKRLAWSPVTKMMEKRRQKVTNDLDQAGSNREKAALLVSQRETASKGSKQETTQILSTAKNNAEKTKSSIISQADQEAVVIGEGASKDVVQAKTDALNETCDQIADIPVAIAERVISRSLSAADQEGLVDRLIKGLND